MCNYEKYYEHLAKRNRKDSTIKSYKDRIDICIKLLESNGLETDPHKMGEDELWFLISNLECQEQSIRMMVEAMNRCIRYHTKKDHMKCMDILWNRPTVKRVFISNDDFIKMYESADPRDRMILILGGALGMRRGEISNQMLNDINNEKITIKGKGHGKNGLVVQMDIPPVVNDELISYMEWRSDYKGKDLSEGRLIVYKDKCGNIRSYNKDKRIYEHVKGLAADQGISATTHSLRRLFCTELKENGCDELTLSDLMRHSNTELLKIYIKPNEDRKKSELIKMTSNLIKL